jgi:hypothetical protein
MNLDYDKDEIFKYLSILLLIATGVVSLLVYFYQHQELFYVRARYIEKYQQIESIKYKTPLNSTGDWKKY